MNTGRENPKAPASVRVASQFPPSESGPSERQEAGGPAPPRTYASVLSRKQPYKRMNLTFVAPSVHEGRPMVDLPPAVVLAGEDKWKHSLIGYVLGHNPTYMEVRNFVRSRWAEHGEVKVHQMGRGLFVFQLESDEAKHKILDEGPWSFSRRPLILRPWTVGMPLDKPDVKFVPLWVQFPFLPLDLWTEEALSLIASYVGTPLFADRTTSEQSRLVYARVCVEVGVDSDLPTVVPIRYANGLIHNQRVEYEWKPVKCHLCKVFGHGENNCPKSAPPEKEEEARTKFGNPSPVLESTLPQVVESRQEVGQSSGLVKGPPPPKQDSPPRVQLEIESKSPCQQETPLTSMGAILEKPLSPVVEGEGDAGKGVSYAAVLQSCSPTEMVVHKPQGKTGRVNIRGGKKNKAPPPNPSS